MKSPEFVPRNDEQKEEDKRLYKNDPGMNTKKGIAGKYVPIKEIVDPSTEEGENLVDIDAEIEDDDEHKPLSRKELDRKEEIEKILKEQKIGFTESDKGNVAHIGPEFYTKKEPNKEEVMSEIVEEKKKHNLEPVIVSPTKEKINAIIYGFRNRKDYSSTKGEGKDNLKTMDDSKKEKMTRGNIREILHDPNKIDY